MPFASQPKPCVFAWKLVKKALLKYSVAPFRPAARDPSGTCVSKFALGAILTQLQEDDQQWHTFSMRLLPAKTNYET